MIRDGASLDAFAIAGVNRRFVWAETKIRGNEIVVTSNEIQKPVAVRYAWAMNPSKRNRLYNKEGFPASPFRTDDWPLFEAEHYVTEAQDKLEKPEGYEQIETKRPPMTQ